jgi:NAD(P)-dependent dehydrogenase (short-subunit alcohol dehydrogenase family)
MSKPLTGQSLSGQVVAVTGAARGIGLAIAKQLIDAGARVAIADRDELALTSAADTLGEVLAVRLDVTDGAAFGAFLDRVENELGPLDALVNNAGIMPTGPFLEETDAVTERIIAVNTTGMLLGSKRALERMVPRGRGHLVNISSTMGLVPLPGLATYCASKAAIAHLGETLAAEMAPYGVAVSTILPGGVNTELASGLDTTATIPLPGGRSMTVIEAIEPEDVAAAVVATLAGGRAEPRLVVPRKLGRMLRVQDLMPAKLRRRISTRLGANEQILGHTDLERRRAYLDRVTRPSD